MVGEYGDGGGRRTAFHERVNKIKGGRGPA